VDRLGSQAQFWACKQLTPRRRLQLDTEAGAGGFVQGWVFDEVVLGLSLENQKWRTKWG